MQYLMTLLFIVGTLCVYILVRHLYLRYQHPLLNIVAVSSAVVITVLLLCGIPYKDYEPAKKIMTLFLGPATVALAIPLYRYRLLLLRSSVAILSSVIVGALFAMLSAGLIAQLGGLPREVVVSILPKGVSMPFAVELMNMYNGIPALAAAFIVATATFVSALGPWALTKIGIKGPTARGLTLGTIAHAQGVAVSLQESEQQGAMAGLAMILAGLLTVLVFPAALWLLSIVG